MTSLGMFGIQKFVIQTVQEIKTFGIFHPFFNWTTTATNIERSRCFTLTFHANLTNQGISAIHIHYKKGAFMT